MVEVIFFKSDYSTRSGVCKHRMHSVSIEVFIDIDFMLIDKYACFVETAAFTLIV